MSELKILDWIDPDEDEQITLADIQFAARDAADYIEDLEAQLAEARELLEATKRPITQDVAWSDRRDRWLAGD